MTEKIHKIDEFTIIEYEKTNIYIIENILDISFCNELIKIIDILPLKKIVHCKGNNVECNLTTIEELLKLNDDFYYSFSTDTHMYQQMLSNVNTKKSIYTNKLNGLQKNVFEKYNSEMNGTMEKIKGLMKEINSRIIFDCNTGYILRKIYGRTRLHIDNVSEIYDSNINFINENKKGDYRMVRNASIVFALNDDYEGGMFNFPYYDVKVKLKKGSVIIFPPYWTHQHEVYGVENNTFRYTITTWSCMNI